jgi:hypothetical protein
LFSSPFAQFEMESMAETAIALAMVEASKYEQAQFDAFVAAGDQAFGASRSQLVVPTLSSSLCAADVLARVGAFVEQSSDASLGSHKHPHLNKQHAGNSASTKHDDAHAAAATPLALNEHASAAKRQLHRLKRGSSAVKVKVWCRFTVHLPLLWRLQRSGWVTSTRFPKAATCGC